MLHDYDAADPEGQAQIAALREELRKLGWIEGDNIRCGYHGLAFDAGGRCVHNPFSDFLPPGAKVETIPTAARFGAIWFWPGKPSLADESLIPDFSFIDDDPDTVRGRTWMGANYELITDNLMDLSHAEFVHTETFGTNGALFGGEYKAVQDAARAIWSIWNMLASQPPSWALPLVPEGALIDQWLEMRWHAPASMALFIGMALTGTDRKQFVTKPMANPHIITPETYKTSHYFYTREPGDHSEEMARRVFNEEDQPMIEAAQKAVGDNEFWSLKPISLASDAAAIAARRRLIKLRKIEAEADPQEVVAA